MTDLRDKIAATIYCHILFRALDQCECGASFDGFCGRAFDAYAAHVADAVIRELGLQPHLAKRIINGKPDQWVRRFVTDWEIVDE